MTTTVTLPVTNKYGYYEIRLESIGGLGANLAGKILGELGALYLGLNSSCFSSYGSEKRGSPVKSFIRYANSDKEIRINSPIENPHILGLFHERMAGKLPVTAGVAEYTSLVVNTAESPDKIRDMLQMHAGVLYCVDALKIAIETKTRVNMVMLGAIARASGFIPLEALKEVITDTIGKKYPAALSGNLEGIERGFDQADGVKYDNDNKYPYVEYKELERDWGFRNAPIGGITPIFGSTVTNDLTSTREGYIPVFKKESCINCGLCDTTCPDMVFQFAMGEYKSKPGMVNLGPDYHHCKGCLRCVEVCPTDALTVGIEREHDLSRTHVRNRELIVEKMEFEDAGSSSWIESESTVVNEVE